MSYYVCIGPMQRSVIKQEQKEKGYEHEKRGHESDLTVCVKRNG